MEGRLDTKRVYRFLDAKPEFLWWEVDDLVCLTGPVILGIMTDHVVVGLGLSLAVVSLYKKLKESSQEGFVKHFLYHHGLLKFRKFPESWVKEFTE